MQENHFFVILAVMTAPISISEPVPAMIRIVASGAAAFMSEEIGLGYKKIASGRHA